MLFRKEVPAEGPDRPSHFREDPNQRTDLNEATLDYPVDGKAPDKPEDYGWPERGGEPSVPVYLTEPVPADRIYRDWAPGTYTVPTTHAVQVGDVDRRRTLIVVRNLDDTNSVVVYRNSTDQDFAGFVIPAGKEREFTHTQAVWVKALTDVVSVTVFSEFEVDDLD